MLNATFTKYTLDFLRPSGTSRGVLTDKPGWFLKVWEEDNPEVFGLGECGPLHWLSIEPMDGMEAKLEEVCSNINTYTDDFQESLVDWPSIRFGLEMALLDLHNGGKRELFPSEFTGGNDSILINGLIWMGEKDNMLQQVEEKLAKGFSCIKLKIGAIDFNKELEVISHIRKHYAAKEIEIRVDANGAFNPKNALDKLKQLSELELHSIEQPIMPKQWEGMAELCSTSPLAIALDEELIGVDGIDKKNLLEAINPQYIILKPTLLGGFTASKEWIDLAEAENISWWATSALESNIGLSAISQWCYQLKSPMPQGLGTGQLYTNNFDSPLHLEGESLFYSNSKKWSLSKLSFA